MSKPRIVFSYYDIHYPEIHTPTLNCMLQMMTAMHAQGIIIGGDGLDNAMISPHTKGKARRRKLAYIKTVSQFDGEVLKQIEKRLPKDALKVYIRANHEDWEDQFIDENPTMDGLQSHLLLKLEERGWKVVPCGELYRLGHITFMHGEWLGGMHHAKKAVETICGNVQYGHFHTMQSFTKVLPYDQKQKWQAQCMPIGGNTSPEWVRNAPNGWVNGFCVNEMHPNGNFNSYPIVISGNQCSFAGRIYKG